MAFERIKEREPSPWFIKLTLSFVFFSSFLHRLRKRLCLSFLTLYLNNKSKVIHEIEILLIVGNELLKNFQRLRFIQLHNVLNCTFFCFLFLFKRCIVFLSTKPVSFPFFMPLESINIIGSIISPFPWAIRDFIKFLSRIKQSRFCPKVINLLGRLFVSLRGRTFFRGSRFFYVS